MDISCNNAIQLPHFTPGQLREMRWVNLQAYLRRHEDVS